MVTGHVAPPGRNGTECGHCRVNAVMTPTIRLEKVPAWRANQPASGGRKAATICPWSGRPENESWHSPGPKNNAACRVSDIVDSAARNRLRNRTACGGGVIRQASSNAWVAATTWLVEQIPHSRAVVARQSCG